MNKHNFYVSFALNEIYNDMDFSIGVNNFKRIVYGLEPKIFPNFLNYYLSGDICIAQNKLFSVI